MRAGIVKRRGSVVTTFNAPSMSFFEAMFGDDFPGEFANGDGRSCKSKRTLLDLPTEMLELICQHLSNMDLKRLRLANRQLAEEVELRIDRVYVSPKRANLDCLNNILNHPLYRLQVQEIVWDEAQLVSIATIQEFCQVLEYDASIAKMVLGDHLKTLMRSGGDDTEFEQIKVEDCVQEDGRPNDIGKAILLSANDHKSRYYIANNAAKMSVKESYELYQKLYQDEKEIIKRGWDVALLQRALTELPTLKRITLTSEVWTNRSHFPSYHTPFFRALPAGFRMPSVVGSVLKRPLPEQRLSIDWRGYSIIMSSLVTCPVPHLREFIVDSGSERVGLPHELVALPNIDYTNTLRMLSSTPLKMLQLPFCDSTAFDHSASRVGLDLLEHVITAAPHLEHLDLKFCIVLEEENLRFPLSYGFFERNCPGLKHIALRHAQARFDWLFNLVTTSKNLQSILLDKIHIIDPAGRRPDEIEPLFFTRLKEHFAAASQQGPSFTWIGDIPAQPNYQNDYQKRLLCQVLDDDLNAFLYDDGELPFYTVDRIWP
jgi:hypothetical protein